MDGWFFWCALTGILLGLRSPVQVVVAIAAILLPSGFVYQIGSGFDVALLTAIGGVVALQTGFMLTTLVLTMVSHRPATHSQPVPQRTKG